MNHIWLSLSRDDIEIEHRQCEEEGMDLSRLEDEFARVLTLDLKDPVHQSAAQSLLDRSIALPQRADFAFVEPSDLAGIRASRPAVGPALPSLNLTDSALEDRLHGAWTGRSVGCLLGKPIEGWRRPRLWGILKETGRWPLQAYLRDDAIPADMREKYALPEPGSIRSFVDHISAMPEDDDLNYTTSGLAILKRYGPDFTPNDVADFWLDNIPLLHTCTAERVAYRNFALLIPPPNSARHRNPYREWIGAQIRADFWGYAAAGNPELAAEFAWRDASISHVKNGIYGEMWAAAMVAAAFVTDDIETILLAGLAQIPARCRLSDAIESVMEWYSLEVDYDTAAYRVHEMWNEEHAHDWCHTIPNAMIVAIGLLWGEGDFAHTICRAVQPCFDTDCNGATTGSILGILHGSKALPTVWTDPIHDTLQTGVSGYTNVKLTDLARESLNVLKQVATR